MTSWKKALWSGLVLPFEKRICKELLNNFVVQITKHFEINSKRLNSSQLETFQKHKQIDGTLVIFTFSSKKARNNKKRGTHLQGYVKIIAANTAKNEQEKLENK